MSQHINSVGSVAIIGAGVSGVASAVHLRRAGLEVTVFERNAHIGGVWVFDERVAKDASYPSILPSVGDSPFFHCDQQARDGRRDSPVEDSLQRCDSAKTDPTSFAPPGPCYIGLRNNVSTHEMEMQCHAFNSGTSEFVSHDVLGQYIQSAAYDSRIEGCIELNTRVESVEKIGLSWLLQTWRLHETANGARLEHVSREFDAVVVASGHYHAPNVPDVPGLAAWKGAFPTRIHHSKLYRRPDVYSGKNILLIGAGTSSLDITRELGAVASSVYQSSRGGIYDLPSHLLPTNCARVGAISHFGSFADRRALQDLETLPGIVTLSDGTKLCNIHHVILCTGYHVSLPFLRPYHADNVASTDASETVLVTDGQQYHNLHKDIFYIPDPTLAFIGVPYHTATFSFFEFQAMALAAVFAGKVPLPSEREMLAEYNERLKRKGAGRTFHSMKPKGCEIAYVDDLVAMVNKHVRDGDKMCGHSAKWHQSYARRLVRAAAMKAGVRDPALEEAFWQRVLPCS